jgi:hypothetical protein
MVWLREQQDGYAILTVRKTERGFELLRVSAHGSEALESFEHCEDAVQRWNQMEKDIRRTLQPTSNHPEGERDVRWAGQTRACRVASEPRWPLHGSGDELFRKG